ncbi:VOC family protein [Corticibacterium sp. UT-5YL-CI-8]|nr:VOC family protein [Tianweitania sp. UT-5YL-CI-8]
MTSTQSKFFWYELMTSDVDAAEAFYKAVVGWQTEPFPASDFKYVIFKPSDAPKSGVAGLMALPEEAAASGMRPAWVGYIHATDVDAATEALRKAGGTVHREPSDIPEVGRFSVVADPQGAMFMLMTPNGEGGEPVPPMTHGHIGWHELFADEWSSAFDFYAGQYGWTKGEPMDMGPMGIYQIFNIDGEMTGGIMTKTADIPHPFWLFYFIVSDIDDAAKRVTDNGGTVLMGPMEVPGSAWVVQCMDPQGAMFALVGFRN